MGSAGEDEARGGRQVIEWRVLGADHPRRARRLMETNPLFPRGGGISPVATGERF